MDFERERDVPEEDEDEEGGGARLGVRWDRWCLRGLGSAKLAKFAKFKILPNFVNFWRARSRLYHNEILEEKCV